jgi:glutathione synthase/RimK-type ligase-like ATP-grasp enzyme
MPASESFLTPYCDEHYAGYLTRQTLFDIIEHAESVFEYPVIVKKNRGSWGTNVFKVNNRRELERSLMDVFNVNSSAFDYVCLVQEYINTGKEYRCVYLHGELVFCYEKVVANARYVGNLSPLHWEGAVARLERDDTVIAGIHGFCSPLFGKLPIPFCGLDVAIDVEGRYFLIEANLSPGFDHILRDGDHGMVAKTYRLMLEYLTDIACAS